MSASHLQWSPVSFSLMEDFRHVQHPLQVQSDLHWADPLFGETKVKDHHQHVCPRHPDTYAIAEHSFNWGCHNSGTLKTLFTITSYMDHIIREVCEIDTHPNMYREDSTRSRKPLIYSVKDWRKHSAKHAQFWIFLSLSKLQTDYPSRCCWSE